MDGCKSHFKDCLQQSKITCCIEIITCFINALIEKTSSEMTWTSPPKVLLIRLWLAAFNVDVI
jgi:hypothetical protein